MGAGLAASRGGGRCWGTMVEATGIALTQTRGPGGAALRLVGGNPSALPTSTATVGRNGFFSAAIGSGTGSYDKPVFQSVYPGIDLQYASTPNQNLEYSFVVHPGAAPSVIRLNATGTPGPSLDAKGNLLLHTATGDLISR